MTPPLTRPITWEIKAIYLGLLAFAIVIPFGRRHDWLGRVAFTIIFLLCTGLWALLIWGMIMNVRQWWRSRRRPN